MVLIWYRQHHLRRRRVTGIGGGVGGLLVVFDVGRGSLFVSLPLSFALLLLLLLLMRMGGSTSIRLVNCI
jgi:hypothetical protein